MKLARFKDGVFQHFLFADAPDGVETFATEQRIPKFDPNSEAPQFSEVILEGDIAFEVYVSIPKIQIGPDIVEMVHALIKDDKAKIAEFKDIIVASDATVVVEPAQPVDPIVK